MFCTYLTTYRGNKLPMFYVGSTSISKINKGYRGSVSSREYKQIWNKEIKENPELFKTIIISRHETRKQALEKENLFHTSLKVSNSILYVNKANAIPNGNFGCSNLGKNNPMFGKIRNDAKIRMSLNNPMKNLEIKIKVSKSKQLLRDKGLHKTTRNSDLQLKLTKGRMINNNPSKIKCSCLNCRKETTFSAIIRFHKNCKGEI